MAERPIERWNRLRSLDSGNGVMEVPSLASDADTGFGVVRFAIGPQGQPRLLVPCGADTKLNSDVSNGRLTKTISRYQVSGRWVNFIDVMCSVRPLDTVFAELADEIIHRIEEGKGPLVAVEGTISDFRALLRDTGTGDVADHEILGLVGELVVLRLLAEVSPSAIEAWTGPFDQRHDFRRKERAIEVKSSIRADATSIAISSIEQLSEPAGGSLILAHVKAERSDEGSLSVSGLVSDIVDQGVPRRPLEAALAAMGCADADAPEWNRIRFGFEGLTAYRVSDGFPRITGAQFHGGVLPAGVSGVTYEVDLASAMQFQMSSSEFAEARKELLS